MKKLFTILAVAFSFTATAQGTKSVNEELKKVDAQIAKAKADAIADVSKFNKLSIGSTDTLEIKPGVKFIKINNMLIPTAAFTQSVPVFLSADAWVAVLEIINTREYGKIPATTIGQIIQAIGQQLPRKEN